MIRAILACDRDFGIAKNGQMPWPKNTDDLKWFRSMTAGSCVVMGRKTWESDMPKPLPNRVNAVVSSSSS
jgi:dihydrofolate reductase